MFYRMKKKEKPTLRDIENQTIIPFAIYQEKEEEIQNIQKKVERKSRVCNNE
ncbi:hypothetical protein OL548_33935 (plasmid) [Lysinibacillus sp. MHQ-1]|nr:hypothetical protein OL548_33935 [Lysinibacillus sp. MHQ-1]